MLFELFPKWLANLILIVILAAFGAYGLVVGRFILRACEMQGQAWWQC